MVTAWPTRPFHKATVTKAVWVLLKIWKKSEQEGPRKWPQVHFLFILCWLKFFWNFWVRSNSVLYARFRRPQRRDWGENITRANGWCSSVVSYFLPQSVFFYPPQSLLCCLINTFRYFQCLFHNTVPQFLGLIVAFVLDRPPAEDNDECSICKIGTAQELQPTI